jgi:hypothetical protein
VIKKIEYASIGFSALGTIMGIATQQLAYVATPITISLSLALINQRKELEKYNQRFERLEQHSSNYTQSTSAQIGTMQVSIQTLYSSPAIANFNNFQDAIADNQQEVRRIGTALVEVETRDSKTFPLLTDIDAIGNSVGQLESQFIEFKEDSLNSSNAQMVRLTGLDLDRIHIYSLITDITSKLNFLAEADLSELRNTSTAHGLKFEKIDRDINKLGALIVDRDEKTDEIYSQYLHDSNLGLDSKIIEIANRIVADKNIDLLIQDAVDRSIQSQFETIKRLLPREYSYELICGRTASRNVFLKTLRESKESIILVCPWIANYAIDTEAKELIVSALQKGVTVNIGWGNLNDVRNDRSKLSKERLLRSNNWGGYGAVPWLYDLQSQYPNLLKIKILGTHEKFLVCDKQFTMLGSHNFMTSNLTYSERELGVLTNNLSIIEDLIELFDNI